MSNLYIRLMTGFWSHRKTARLRSIIGDDALWVVPRLWSYAAENQPDGDLSGYTSEELAMLLGCPKHAPSMLQALKLSGFVEEDGKIHDWQQHNGFHSTFSKRAKAAAEARWKKEKEQKKQDLDNEKEIERETSIAPSMLGASASPQNVLETPPATTTPPEAEKTQGDGNAREIEAFKIRVGSMFRRRPNTAWSPKEMKALAAVLKFETPEEDILALEKRYATNDKYLRKDVITLLNNWNGEIDKARNGTASGPNHSGHGANGNPRNEGIAGFDGWHREFQARAAGDGKHGPWDDFGRRPEMAGADPEAGRVTPPADCPAGAGR